MDMIRVTLVLGSGNKEISVQPDTKISQLIMDGHLQSEGVASTRVNRAPASCETTLRDGDEIEQVKLSGVQG